MEKKVENPKSTVNSVDSVQENLGNGKELIQLFQKMNVARDKEPVATRSSTKLSKPTIHRIHPSSKLKKKTRVTKKTRQIANASIQLRPSKLTHVVAVKAETAKANSSKGAESRFVDFSADCSRELETIVKDSSKSTTEIEKSTAPTKNTKRKTSCAQQARNEYLPSSEAVNLSIDILTDYLDEAVLFPKKMSYMAELMYT